MLRFTTSNFNDSCHLCSLNLDLFAQAERTAPTDAVYSCQRRIILPEFEVPFTPQERRVIRRINISGNKTSCFGNRRPNNQIIWIVVRRIPPIRITRVHSGQRHQITGKFAKIERMLQSLSRIDKVAAPHEIDDEIDMRARQQPFNIIAHIEINFAPPRRREISFDRVWQHHFREILSRPISQAFCGLFALPFPIDQLPITIPHLELSPETSFFVVPKQNGGDSQRSKRRPCI